MSNYQPQNYMSARRKSSVLTNSQDHLWGIRAILAVQSFAWLFFKVFNPALTIPSATPTGEHIPDASPSTVPGVFGGPGIVGPGADSGIVARGLQTRDLYTRNLGMSTFSLFLLSANFTKWKARAMRGFEWENIGEMSATPSFVFHLTILDISILRCRALSAIMELPDCELRYRAA
jgi:hypothetical protein